MVNLRAALAIAMALLAFPAHGALSQCSTPSNTVGWHSSGPAVRALVELWWKKKRQPMRRAPDLVTLDGASGDDVSITYFRDGCQITVLTLPKKAVGTFLERHLGPSI